MRVLISAYACEPDSGSEPGVGWNWSVQAARHGHDVVVITRANNREAIEAEMRREPIAGIEFVYLDLPRPFLVLEETARILRTAVVLLFVANVSLVCGETLALARSVRFGASRDICQRLDASRRGECWCAVHLGTSRREHSRYDA